MPSNPTTEGPVKSLRQVPPGGYAFPALFGAFALLIAIGIVRGGPTSAPSLLVSGVVLLAFLLPAYVLWSSSRDSGVFIDADRVEFRVLGRVRYAWPRSEVQEIKPALRGVAVVGTDGRTLREFHYRYWRADQVEALARSAGLAPAPVGVASELNPGGAPGAS
jgi:hypothetical protein